MKQIVMYSPANFSPRKTGEISTKARPMTVLDYGLLAMDSGIQVLDSNLFLWNLDSGFQSLVEFWILGYGFQSFSVESGFWIPIFSGIPDSLCCIQILKSRIQDSTSKLFLDSGSHKQKFTGFWNPDFLSWCDKASERVLQRARQQGHRHVQSTFCQGFIVFLAGSFCLLFLLFFLCYKAAIRS